jgi:signal transduction histidine kinase
MLRLISNYLDFAKIDAGYLRLDRQPSDLAALVRRAAATAEPQAGVKRQELRVHAPEGELIATVDAEKLEQALENLLSNAVKYTPDGGTIDLSLASSDGRARFTVRDSGVGIEPDLIPSLFAKYQRLPGRAARMAGGTGLGLLIAREIVEAHGGTIGVTSTGVAGEGTTFEIEIP